MKVMQSKEFLIWKGLKFPNDVVKKSKKGYFKNDGVQHKTDHFFGNFRAFQLTISSSILN